MSAVVKLRRYDDKNVEQRRVRTVAPRRHVLAVVPRLSLRGATRDDADAIFALITANMDEGRLLPRTRDEIALHAHRFVVIVTRQVVGCAELAPLSRTVAEVRSLVVDQRIRARGAGRQLLDALTRLAAARGFETLCAFTHAPGFFVRVGFSIVPHSWVPEKINTDCQGCPAFRQCGQYAVVLPLEPVRHACVPLASLHG